jgi:hypothetical protein
MQLADDHPLRTALAAAARWHVNLDDDTIDTHVNVSEDNNGIWHTSARCEHSTGNMPLFHNVPAADAAHCDRWCGHCQDQFARTCHADLEAIIRASILLTCTGDQIDTQIDNYRDSTALAAYAEIFTYTSYGHLCRAAADHTRTRLAPRLTEHRTQRLWTAALTHTLHSWRRGTFDILTNLHNTPWWELTLDTARANLVDHFGTADTDTLLHNVTTADTRPHLAIGTGSDYIETWLWPHARNAYYVIIHAPQAAISPLTVTTADHDLTEDDLAVIASLTDTSDKITHRLADYINTARSLRPTATSGTI